LDADGVDDGRHKHYVFTNGKKVDAKSKETW